MIVVLEIHPVRIRMFGKVDKGNCYTLFTISTAVGPMEFRIDQLTNIMVLVLYLDCSRLESSTFLGKSQIMLL